MQPPTSQEPEVCPHGSPVRRRAGAVLLTLIGAFLLVPSTSGAATTPSALTPQAAASPGNSDKLDKLSKQIKALEKKYGDDFAQLRDAKWAAEQALKKSRTLQEDLAGARVLVAQMAASQYISSGVDPTVSMLSTDDPSGVLDGATLASHLSRNRAAKVNQIQSLINQQDKARKEAVAKIAGLQKNIKDLQGQKTRMQQLINKFKPSSPLIGASGLTARLIKVRSEVDTRFGPFPVIGCLRPGDPQDHGTGRACDFMESTGGSMPSADRIAHGTQVANWVIANASRLGVKYVIWRQRIYDMRSPGWRAMSDRGGITANHFDHVHISVF
ncbi:coiled-coil domain-containing protein [Actinomadura scrupuli]|uniref:coiled-coil domain-containing protein n=1 Tax=Actinomadura scrupuli TaxID=559629 RepID=UPI003D98906E